MITKKDSISYQPANRLEEKYFTQNSIFFDIETTGFSAVRNDLYLIGCGYRDDKDFQDDSLPLSESGTENRSM